MSGQISAKHNLFLNLTTRVLWLYLTRHKETSSCPSFQRIQGFQKHTSPTFILAFAYIFPSGCNPNPHLGWRQGIPTPNYWIRLVRVRLLRCPSSSPSSVISQNHKGQVASHKSPPHVWLNRAVHATSFLCEMDMITSGRVLACQHVGFWYSVSLHRLPTEPLLRQYSTTTPCSKQTKSCCVHPRRGCASNMTSQCMYTHDITSVTSPAIHHPWGDLILTRPDLTGLELILFCCLPILLL